jgi:hypothetical protein
MVKPKNSDITYSNTIMVFVRAGKNHGVTKQAHVEFANVRDDEAAFRQFTNQWGPLSSLPMVHLSWKGWRDLLRRAWSNEDAAIDELRQWAIKNMVTSLNFDKGRIELATDPLLGAIYLLFLRDHLTGKTAVCANPDCKELKYFLRAKGRQRFCGSKECNAVAQRAYTKKWWDKDGKLIRDERRKKAKRKAGK